MSHEVELNDYARQLLRPPTKETPSQWCERNIVIPPPQTQTEGPFRLHGREYCREVIDDFANHRITDEVACFGSQTAKTNSLMMGVAWSIANDPCGILWVMPNIDLARSFSETRWTPIIDATLELSALKPSGARRHDFKKTQQQIGTAVINFIGSNSPANLASRPARRVILDEVDKFDEGGRGEADAVNLAEQRTKSFANPQRWKTSTPTLVSGLIWQEFLKGDRRRYFVPCPHCLKHILLAWSPTYCVFTKLGCEAYVKWDREAKRADGTWDLERVQRSARAECPHCGGHINDGHKTRMVREGVWKATVTAPDHFRSRHLPSLYASAPETGFGKLAVKFLQAKQSLLGLQGFINGDLAEPYQSQDTLKERIELVTSKVELKSSMKLMTVDCQAKSPHFWFSVREWADGNSRGIEAASVDTWEELREKQEAHKIPDVCVCVDSGFGAISDAEVYKNCVRFSELIQQPTGKAFAVGWMPAKGMTGRKKWKDEDSGALVPWFLAIVDPFLGTSHAGEVSQSLFEFSGDFFKDILQALREKKGGYEWSVSESVSTDTYWQHMDAEVKMAVMNRVTGRVTHEWRKRSAHWPNHLLDCEVQQIAFASFHKLFVIS